MTASYVMANDSPIRSTIDLFTARVRHDFDVHLEALSANLSELTQARGDANRAELDHALAEARAEAERAHLELLGRLLSAVRRIDDESTLTGILEGLARGAAVEASRAAILLVDGDRLRTWGHFGFPAEAAPVDLSLDQASFVTAAVALRQTSFVPPSMDGQDSSAPAFMRVPPGHTGLVAPIMVGNDVVAVLYADDVDRPTAQEEAPVWADVVELLVRHASARLENVTSLQTVDLLTNV
jgi:hypothetical protein